MEEHRGPITNWAEFESYPWPDPKAITTRSLEWLHRYLPEDMCIMGLYLGHFCEHICFLMGYETLCFALYEQRDPPAGGLRRQATQGRSNAAVRARSIRLRQRRYGFQDRAAH